MAEKVYNSENFTTIKRFDITTKINRMVKKEGINWKQTLEYIEYISKRKTVSSLKETKPL